MFVVLQNYDPPPTRMWEKVGVTAETDGHFVGSGFVPRV